MNSALPRQILGWLIMAPRLIGSCNLSVDDFPTGRHRQVFEIVSDLWENARPEEIPLVVLAERLGGDGPAAFIGNLLDGIQKPTPENFATVVREMRRRGLSEKIVTAAEKLGLEHVKTGAFDDKGFSELRSLIVERDEFENLAIDVKTALKRGLDLQALDLQIEYVVNKLVLAQALNVIHGSGGIGKTQIGLQASKAVVEGQELFSLQTKKRPVVYIDFENPLPILVERARKLDIRDVLFWHQSFEPKPPKLDSDGYALYKTLPPQSLLIFDTLRAAQDGDENDSKDMALVMGRLKEIRDAGFTILIIHHTPRANDRASKGSTAITDLADHVLSLYRVKRSTFEKIDDELEPGPDDYLRLGTGEKTRYEHHQIFLKQSESGAFVLANDPDQEHLDAISEFVRSSDHALTQSEIFAWAKAELEISKKGKLVNLLRKGEKKRWISTKSGNRRTYVSI